MDATDSADETIPSKATTHKTKTQLAIDALREAIAEGKIKRGEHLTVNRISALLGMSPTPVREAFRILQTEGLISHTPHHGVTVADLTVEQALQIYPLRSLLESLAVLLAVTRMTEEDCKNLVTLEKTMLHALSVGDNDQLSRANTDWHLMFARLSGNQYLHEFILRLWHLYPQDAIWGVLGRTAKSMQEHHNVTQAVLAGDSIAASEAMKTHILSVQHDIVTHLQKQPDAQTNQQRIS